MTYIQNFVNKVPWKIYVIFFFIFCLCLSASSLVPLHSDDYGYWLKGFSWENHIQHYQSWSGRFIVDYLSSIVLSTPRWIYVCFAPVLLTSLIFLISYLPHVVCGATVKWWMPLVILAFYWVANPNLGQTSFWIVGVSNYLYPPVISLLTVFLIFSFKTGSLLQKVLLFLFGALSGFSSESAAVSFCVGVLLLGAINYKNKKLVTNCIFSFGGGLVGILFLLLAPGNFVRMQSYKDWEEQSLFLRLLKGFRTSFLRVVKAWPVVLIPLATFLLAKKRKIAPDQNFKYCLLFFLIGCSAYFSMLVSPTFPPRAANPGFIWMLVSLSFAFPLISRAVPKICKIYGGVIVGLFCISYVFVFNSFLNNNNQDKVRIDNLIYEQKTGIRETQVPGWYFSRTLRKGETIDPWESWAIGSFYGMDKTHEFKPSFNYGVIKRGEKIVLSTKSPSGTAKVFYLNDVLDGKQTLAVKIPKGSPLPKKIEIDVNNRRIEIIPQIGNNVVSLCGEKFVGVTENFGLSFSDFKSASISLFK